MAQPKKTTKTTSSTKRKTNKGGLKQTNLNFLSWKILVPALVLFAAVGGYYVSQSFAASWYSVDRSTYGYESGAGKIDTVTPGRGDSLVSLRKGRTYRFCARGHSRGKTTVKISFSVEQPSSSKRRGAASSTKSYGKSSALHCSKTFNATKNYSVRGYVDRVSGNTMYIEASSVDELR